MTPFLAKMVWGLGLVIWYLIRYPHERRARRTPIARRAVDARELLLMTVSLTGLAILPMIYVVTNQPKFANYPFQPAAAWLGTLTFAASLYLFYRTHRDLGRAWSVTLAIRDRHALVTHGVYRLVRHPMYSAFFLWALAQALLLPNYVGGLAGLVGFGTLFLGRVGQEERLMLATFGDEYRAYMARTKRIIPYIY